MAGVGTLAFSVIYINVGCQYIGFQAGNIKAGISTQAIQVVIINGLCQYCGYWSRKY